MESSEESGISLNPSIPAALLNHFHAVSSYCQMHCQNMLVFRTLIWFTGEGVEIAL